MNRYFWSTLLLVLVVVLGFVAAPMVKAPIVKYKGAEPNEPPAPADTLVDVDSPVEVASEPAPEADSTVAASFAVQVRDDVIPYRIFGIYVMPDEVIELEAIFTTGRGSVAISAEAGTVVADGLERWAWTAPGEPGVYRIHLEEEETGEVITLNAFVKVPYNLDQEELNGYRIGQYQRTALRGNPVYNPPQGFVEVRPEVLDAHVSPHFTLGQFLCKQADPFPKYLLLRERLVLKLEMMLESVQESGVEASTLFVMSGFRTPHYNWQIGNRTSYSRHLYGGAADVYVDVDEDGMMDDLNGDGHVTVADAQVMAAIIEDAADETWYQPFVGGLGIYGPAPHRGPFIHVDVRGQRARW